MLILLILPMLSNPDSTDATDSLGNPDFAQLPDFWPIIYIYIYIIYIYI